ncbi:MAG: allantoinase AllB [Armatimonadota bacterium]|nr:allantoinase AllB [Armatimonadota bacterium]MDR7450048.1 allantoinase AllB [Armatimonadota bacterium]MDR7458977.1 allantoinase AllB [Armatimonadota bacterium]MDR7478878.1 allantoinase AllB [Armatimonadota bacterium]MDR7488280.1 allantoinase AllB [Armatimonadota bacterium]
MTVDLVIRGGTVVTADGARRLAVAVQGETIAALDRDDAMPPAREVLDADGLYVLPGVIDTHTHLREPGNTDREDWETGTRAAAAGGVTTVLEMPTASPPVNAAGVLVTRAARVQPRAYVDFGLYGGASADNLADLLPLAEAGAVAFKTFRTRAFPGREGEFLGICCPDAGGMWQAMAETARTGRFHVVHAEEQQVLDAAYARVRAQGLRGGPAHAAARPEVAEVASVAQCLALAASVGTRIQFAHLSTRAAVDLVAAARDRGVRATVETCPHYLTFSEETLEAWGPLAKSDPPLRPRETVEQLWEAVRAGLVDVIGSDHAPFTLEEKQRGADDIFQAPSGIAGLELLLPLMLTHVHAGRLSLPALVRLTSENPARLFGLWPRKGRLAVGADADLVIVDLHAERIQDHRRMHTKAAATARLFDGIRLRGLPVYTLIRGRVVMRQGEVVGPRGWGRWVRPT